MSDVSIKFDTAVLSDTSDTSDLFDPSDTSATSDAPAPPCPFGVSPAARSRTAARPRRFPRPINPQYRPVCHGSDVRRGG